MNAHTGEVFDLINFVFRQRLDSSRYSRSIRYIKIFFLAAKVVQCTYVLSSPHEISECEVLQVHSKTSFSEQFLNGIVRIYIQKSQCCLRRMKIYFDTSESDLYPSDMTTLHHKAKTNSLRVRERRAKQISWIPNSSERFFLNFIPDSRYFRSF